MIYDLQQYRDERPVYNLRQFQRDIRAILRHLGHREQHGFFTRQIYRDQMLTIVGALNGNCLVQFSTGTSIVRLRMGSPEAEHCLRLAIRLEELGFDLDTDPIFL